MHKTTTFCQFGNLEICPNFANPYLTQFSSISGGNCINVGKNGEHSYGENFIYEYSSKMHIKSTQHMGILHAFSNCVRETFNRGLSPSEVEWGDPKGEPTKHGPNYTSSGCMLMEVDWGGKLIVNFMVNWGVHETYPNGHNISAVDWGDHDSSCNHYFMVNWGVHETYPNGHNISAVDWGDHDSSCNHMNKFSLSEVDWRSHDSSLFLFLVNIDYDAKPKDFSTQELWGGLPQRTSSTPLIGLNNVEGKFVHHLALQKGPNCLDHQLDQQWDPTQSLDHLLSSSDPDLCPSLCLSLTITVLLVGHSYYLLKKMGRDLTSSSLMAYLKYSFDIEDGFSNSKSIKQYGSSYCLPDLEQHESSYNLLTQWDPGEKPLQPPVFRKAIATKIFYFVWIQSECNLSCMLSKQGNLARYFQ